VQRNLTIVVIALGLLLFLMIAPTARDPAKAWSSPRTKTVIPPVPSVPPVPPATPIPQIPPVPPIPTMPPVPPIFPLPPVPPPP
jgi:hypothetical protein